MKFLKKVNKENILSLVASLIIFSAIPVAFAWTGPSATPPSGNVSAPVNVGTTNQVKEATLGLNGLGVFGRGLFSRDSSYSLPSPTTKPEFLLGVNGSIGAKEYCDQAGQNCFNPGSVLPSGAVMSFDLPSCPAGWSDLPASKGRVIIGAGTSNAPYATNIPFSSTGGEAKHVLSIAEMPSHNHQDGYGRGTSLEFDWFGTDGGGTPFLAPKQTDGFWAIGDGIGPWGQVMAQGGGQPHNNLPPYYALTYCRKN